MLAKLDITWKEKRWYQLIKSAFGEARNQYRSLVDDSNNWNNLSDLAEHREVHPTVFSNLNSPGPMQNQSTFGSEYAAQLSLQYLEFDGQQVEIRTDVPVVAQSVARTHAHMLVPYATNVVGAIELLSSGPGYRFKSRESRFHPADELDYLMDLIRDEVRAQFVDARPDLLWLHSAAVVRNGHALLLAGPSGAGKSTLSTLLCEKGWSLMSDDVAPVTSDGAVVLPFAEEPRRRRYPGRGVDSSYINSLHREPVVIDPVAIWRGSARLSAIVFIVFEDAAPARLERLRPGTSSLEILRNVINFDVAKGDAVERVAEMARRVPGYSIIYGSAPEASALLDSGPF